MIYDVIIIGSGAAALTAAIYSVRYKLNTLVIGKEIGGKMIWTPTIENYPGFGKISGIELSKKMEDQVKKLGVKVLKEEVKMLCREKELLIIKTEKQRYEAKSVIVAWGTQKRKLDVENEDKYIGKGIAYCATCDAPLFRNKDVVVVGGGNSAAIAVDLLKKYAKKIYMVYLDLFMDPSELEKIKKDVEIIQGTIKKIGGDKFVKSVTLNSGRKLDVQGIFVEIGDLPNEIPCEKIKIKTNKQGYILTDQNMKTSVNGIFAIGDCISKPLKQIVTAASDGATAAHSAYKFLK
ncbi:MAG: FAD-dependent oxidoreductase [archaeon]|nr:MAG: FAD-dependent oxidoreductase [archaeon]